MPVAMMAAITAGAQVNGPSTASSMATSAIAEAGGTSSAAPFGNLLTDAMQSVSLLETQAHAAVDGMMAGTGVDVHEAVIATQKANMAFELALAVRSKAVQAYQSVMGMQF